MTFPNPYTARIQGDSNYSFSFVSQAQYFQRATVSVGQVSIVFNGQGEGVAMTQQDGSTSYRGTTKQPMSASVLFEYSQDGATYILSTVAQVWNTSTLVMVGTEDATDDDNNDTEMTLTIAPL